MNCIVIALALPLGALAHAVPEGGWRGVSDKDGIRVEIRSVPGARVREVQANADIEATPAACYAVVHAFAAYPVTMPYVKAARVLQQAGEDLVWTYTRVEAPLVSARDYGLRVQTARDADGTIHMSWVPANELAPPPKDGVVRIEINTGSWTFRPLDGGTRTRATYYVLTDPGGAVTSFIADQANKKAVPDVIRAVRKAVSAAR